MPIVKLNLICGTCTEPISPDCRDWCKPRKKALQRRNDGSTQYPILEALFERLENKMREAGFITEYDIIDEVSRLESNLDVDQILIVQELLGFVVKSVPPADVDSTMLLGRATHLLSENLMRLAHAQEQHHGEGEESRYFTEARLMQKTSADHFMHAGVLSVLTRDR